MKVYSNLVLMISLVTALSTFSANETASASASVSQNGSWGYPINESQVNDSSQLSNAYSSLQINYGTEIHSIMPRNNMRIPITMESTSKIDQTLFFAVIKRIQSFYRIPIIGDWASSEVNAYATGFGIDPKVVIFGGIGRHPDITPDGLAIVICHEMGHHLGGAPADEEGASNEGESDYFSTTKCMKTALRGLDNYSVAKSLYNTRKDLANDYLISACQASFNTKLEVDLCVRASAGGMSTAQMFHSFEPRMPEPRYETPDRFATPTMVNEHPETQCRLDTYFQGSLCNVSDKLPLSKTTYEGGACTARKGFKVGLRPLCWFNESRTTRFSYRGL